MDYDDIRWILSTIDGDDALSTRQIQAVDDAVDAIDQLHADAKRLDWLSNRDNTNGNVQLPTKCVEANLYSLRAAIDAAMELDTSPNT